MTWKASCHSWPYPSTWYSLLNLVQVTSTLQPHRHVHLPWLITLSLPETSSFPAPSSWCHIIHPGPGRYSEFLCIACGCQCTQAPNSGGSGKTRSLSEVVLTSGDLAGVNLLAWFILIRRRKIFHGMEREFRFKVICTQGNCKITLITMMIWVLIISRSKQVCLLSARF